MGDAVLATLAADAVDHPVDIVFLDTGYHFAETIGTRDAVAAMLPVNVRTILPLRTVAEQDAEYGPQLHDRDPDRCCALRKVEPLARALAPYHAWASGIRRDEATTRREIGVVEWDDKRGMVKVNPLAGWTQDDVDRYIAERGVLVNPLVYDGYPSIGCAPCTRRVAPGEDARAGRWAGTGKTECGLHG
jgi:phosphoadenosine phosphosulfate reductase